MTAISIAPVGSSALTVPSERITTSPLRRQIIFRARAPGDFMRGRACSRVEDELHDTFAVAQIDKDEAAVVAARRDPSPERDFAAGVGGAQGAAVVRPRPGRERRIFVRSGHQITSVEEYLRRAGYEIVTRRGRTRPRR